MTLKPFWVRWEKNTKCDMNHPLPWWITGSYDADNNELQTCCAAVMAHDAAHAEEIILRGHDETGSVEFVDSYERPPNWSPFSAEFQREDWMRWPWPTDHLASEGKTGARTANWLEELRTKFIRQLEDLEQRTIALEGRVAELEAWKRGREDWADEDRDRNC